MNTQNVLVVGVGGLGTCMVQEALDRGLQVSVLVRNPDKLDDALGGELKGRLAKINVGDGTDPQVLDKAVSGVDVVLSGRGADPQMAEQLAAAVKRNNVQKLCWPAGTTNVMADDGVTPNYKALSHLGSWVEKAYKAHGACIDAIQNAGINFTVFCAGRMESVGKKSQDTLATIKINRDAGPFVSYEDAAWVMLEAATTDTYDRQLVSASTQR